MIVLSGADLVLPDRVLATGTVVIEGDRFVEVTAGRLAAEAADDVSGHYIVPGFIDVHVHGLAGVDVLDGPEAIATLASRLPRHGVVAFCPTTVACTPARLRTVLEAVERARAAPIPAGARVLPAHLESNFLNPAYRGAQPLACLRPPPPAVAWPSGERAARPAGPAMPGAASRPALDDPDAFDGRAVLAEIEAHGDAVGIVTLAPELPGGVELVGMLARRGVRVAIGHSGASFEEAMAAIEAGARHATHLFNRMRPLAHRDPGLVGAVLTSDEVAAEIICDGYHVHPAVVRVAVAAKTPARILAITDGTAGSGLPPGTRTRLGTQPVTVGEQAVFLDDGTLAGSRQTMDGAFRVLVEQVGLSLADAARLCATTPAAELGLTDRGVLAPGKVADFVVLDRDLHVVRTYVAGREVYRRGADRPG